MFLLSSVAHGVKHHLYKARNELGLDMAIFSNSKAEIKSLVK